MKTKIAKSNRSKYPEKVVNALLDAVWVMRWNKKRTGVWAVLEPEEAEQAVADIFKELKGVGYEICKKKVKKKL